jgi:thioredoxin 1
MNNDANKIIAKHEAIAILAEDFKSKVMSCDIPVLVDWWANWCGPCRMLAPTMNQLADEYYGKAVVVKINCEDDLSLAMEQSISSLPTISLWKNGKEVSRMVGLRSINEYRKAIDDIIAR